MAQCLSVIGLGYVGLPLACAFAQAGFEVIAYDKSISRIKQLRQGIDKNTSIPLEDLKEQAITFTNDHQNLIKANCHIIAVPTPITPSRRPDLSMLLAACKTLGQSLSKGDMVVIESTVYPGVCEDIAAPEIEKVSGLKLDRDFELAYSPERINPGDDEHNLASTIKIVSARTPLALERVKNLYKTIIKAGLHVAPSIQVAEAAKTIENTQRDLNIALMNELAMLFHQLGLDSGDVLAAARSKWNFLPFTPGLVGGHCIGVDPYYLSEKAHEVGFEPQLTLAGRQTNEAIPGFIAEQLMQHLSKQGVHNPINAVILGATYKANVPDIRNSKALELATALEKYGAIVQLVDPLIANGTEQSHSPLKLTDLEECYNNHADLVILAVPHKAFYAASPSPHSLWPLVQKICRPQNAIIADIYHCLERNRAPKGQVLWRL
ncbi:nucleotide sugar dehydrogenase [Polycladidibacter stylochi]|uniref:nucleotide sugar dehydrogenase n=1 Tax=Polycladidibacter stylochi TaxID=1807766 RepID=UPI00082AF0D4|nr:nucleotide sugar dehydrogenase [Pseudovibrio stylochi]